MGILRRQFVDILPLRVSPKTAFGALGNKDLRQKPSRHLLNMG